MHESVSIRKYRKNSQRLSLDMRLGDEDAHVKTFIIPQANYVGPLATACPLLRFSS